VNGAVEVTMRKVFGSGLGLMMGNEGFKFYEMRTKFDKKFLEMY
jgi:hypothetical protein